MVAFGVGFMVKDLELLTAEQVPPVVVSVRVTVPLKFKGGVYVALSVVALGEKVPPIPPSVQMPPVADPPTDPPSPVVVPFAQMAESAAPTLTVGNTGVIEPVLIGLLTEPQFPRVETDTDPNPDPIVIVAEVVPCPAVMAQPVPVTDHW